MSNIIYKNYVFSSQEFMVLSACVGIEKIPVLFAKDPRQPDEGELAQTIFELYQKGILVCEDDGSYSLQPDVRILFQDMKAAQKELHIYSKKTGGPLLCFWDENAVVTELSGSDKSAVKMHSLPSSELLEELKDRGILPERDSKELGQTMGEDAGALCAAFLKDSPAPLQEGHMQYELLEELLEKKRDLFAFITIYDRTLEENQGAILILNCGLTDCIAFMGDGMVHTCYYALEDLRELFQR